LSAAKKSAPVDEESSSRRKKIAAGLAAAAALIAFGFFFFRSGASGVETPVATLSSKDLVREFQEDPDYARDAYCRQLVQVTGVVKSVEGDAAEPALIVLGEKGNGKGTVACAPVLHEGVLKEALAKVGQGKTAIIKGVCEGTEGETVVKLVACKVISVQ
jgi:hypothetical protein